ncbi:hypothetical protein RvY_12894 [Ramazzottius varieornatus]|uniref:Uncharacterized protein n=1 Tax=Ramazzottius varieornatus TaxID=947166 RepID=A0A1D1VUP1_RAMVA|nr:hypothetical protein RvY_12894 [Ramazzottius varieornatus]
MHEAGNTARPLLERASGNSVVGIRKLRPETADDHSRQSRGGKATVPKQDETGPKTVIASSKKEAAGPKKEVKESVATNGSSQYAMNGKALRLFNPAHHFGTRKEDHINQCTRAPGYGKKLPQCNYNRLFSLQEADHHRVCCKKPVTALTSQVQYERLFPRHVGVVLGDEANWT